MEFGSNKDVHDQSHCGSKRGVPEDDRQDVAVADIPKEQPDSSAATPKVHKFQKVPSPWITSAEVNMEVPVTADDVMQAGGLGATDDISSILPVASDFTDLENHLSEVRGYEESEDKFTEKGQTDPLKAILEVDEGGVEDNDNVNEHMETESPDAFEAVDMQGSLTSEEFIRAGGFGATDNISSFLPVASDFTDFEAHIRDARDYEDLEEKTHRPGLGWTSETK